MFVEKFCEIITRAYEIITTLINKFKFCYCHVKRCWRKINDWEQITNENEMSHNGKKLRSYPAKAKLEAVQCAEINHKRVKLVSYIIRVRWVREKQK